MIQRCIVLLVVGLIIDGGYAINLINFNTAISWGEAMMNYGTQYYSEIRVSNSTSMGKLDELIQELEEYSHKYEVYLTYATQKRHKRFRRDKYESEELKFSNFMNNVKRIFNNVKLFRHRRPRVDKITKRFVNKILWGSNNLPDTLNLIHQFLFPSTSYISPGFIQQMISNFEQNDRFDCDKFMSAQQYVYYIYVNLLLAEMQGLTILTYVYSLQQSFHISIDYARELNIAKNAFVTRVIDYYQLINEIIILFPRLIRQCDVNLPQRDVNFLEFVNYHRIILLDQKRPIPKGNDNKDCVPQCKRLDNSISVDTYKQKIYNCQNIGYTQSVILCSARPGTSRKYLWWKYKDDTYGQVETCPTKLRRGNGNQISKLSCNICACSSVMLNYTPKEGISRFSITSQVSDIANNMVVVGIRFVTYDDAIHLQIKQSNLLPLNATNNSMQWKNLDDLRFSIEKRMEYKTLHEVSGQLHLDDVMLPPTYAITGVKLGYRERHVKGFFLLVRGTPFTAKTGKLNSEASIWFIPGDFDFSNISDYRRDRIKINMDNMQDPSRCIGYNYDSGTNKYIKFQHSSMKKDGGQSTIPYIDAQPVETHTQFPLSGIGLFYREKSGCGGYVAPRIFTVDMSHYL